MLNADEQIRKRIMKQIVTHTRTQLQFPRPPAELRGYVAALMDVFGCKDLFTRPELNFVREAFVAAKVGIIRDASSAALIDAARPDFELRVASRTELYELVEADTLDRRRSDEYKAGNRIQHWPEPTSGEEAFRLIHKAAKAKAKKAAELIAKGTPYPNETRLLFYLNHIWNFGGSDDEIEIIFSAAVEPARKWFSSIWLLWKEAVYQV